MPDTSSNKSPETSKDSSPESLLSKQSKPAKFLLSSDSTRNVISILALIASIVAVGISIYTSKNGKKLYTTSVINTFHANYPSRGVAALKHLATLSNSQLEKAAKKEPYIITTIEQMKTLKDYMIPDSEEAYLIKLPIEVRGQDSFQVSTDAFNLLNQYELALEPWQEGLVDEKMIRDEFKVTLVSQDNLTPLISRLKAARGKEASDAWICIEKFIQLNK